MKQNLVFIMTDQQRADTLGMSVGGREVTPCLNLLSKESTVFERAYDACPLCVPARTALATGINPVKSGMMLNDLPGTYAKNHETIHQMLFKAGYEVAHIGVNHISVKPALKDSLPFAAWEDDDTYRTYARERGLDIDRKPEDSVVIDELSDGVYEKHRYSNARTSIWPYDLDDFKDVWFTTKAVDFLAMEHKKPFALFLYLWAPHPPLVVPKEHWDLFDEKDICLPPGTGNASFGQPENRKKGAAAQLGCYPPEGGWQQGWHAHLALSHLCDEQMGRIRSTLSSCGLADNTMVVFTADHGEHMGQHGMYQKMEMYEPAVRVPAIFHLPKTPSCRLNTAVSHLDFVPTLIDILGLETGNPLDGHSLKESILTGKEPKAWPVFGVYCGNHQFGDMRRMIVKENFKYIYDNVAEELYDLSSDPYEQTNLCSNSYQNGKFRMIARELYCQLEDWASKQEDPFFIPKGRKKNLLFVFADQWRRDAMGFAGKDPVKTPNMDAFASQSVYCTDAISTFPLCSPHRASLLTGKHPLSTGVFTNCKTGLHMGLKEEEICIGDILKSNGYHTGYIGKWHLDEPEQNSSPNPESGASHWDAYTPPGPKRHGFDFWYSYGAWDQHLTPHYWMDSPCQIKADTWSPEHETDIAIDYMKKHNGNGPFALFVSWNPPHSPYDMVPQKYLDLYETEEIPLKANVDLTNIHHHTYEPAGYTKEELLQVTKEYFAAVSGLDDQFGRLIRTLKELGIYDDTLIILSADHGDMMGSHGLMAKHVWYEESVGIPLVIGGAGLKPSICRTLIGSPDFMPTVLGLLDLPVPSSVEGQDCSQDVKGYPVHQNKACFLAACPGRDVFLKAFEAAGKNPLNFGWRGIRTSRYLYVVDAGYGTEPCLVRLLYDLEADPLQMSPVTIRDLKEYPIADQLEQELCRWLQEQNDGFLVHLDGCPKAVCRITEARLYLYQVNATKKFSFGTWTSRQHVIVSIKAGGETGFGENIISVNHPDISLEEWSSWLRELVGLSVSSALIYLRDRLDCWQDRMTEMTEMCLIDLSGKLNKKNALDLLGISGTAPVYGVYVILSDDPDFVEQKVRYAISAKKTRFIKVKLFGNEELDCKIIRKVRNYLSRGETFLIGDVNCGYRPQGTEKALSDITASLRHLYEAGLDACEDPAYLERDEWVQLQSAVHPLSLIPDYPMRPSRKAKEMIVKGMGDIYNIHPGSSASIIDAVSLAKQIKRLGAKLMIGDDSLVGPGCTIWQQLAVGLSADWVEATEKELESDFYYSCVTSIPTDSRRNPISPDRKSFGFGIYLDENRLEKMADQVVIIRK